MKKGILLLLMLVVGAAGVIGYLYWRSNQANQYLEKAVKALKEQEFSTARVFAEKSLAIQSENDRALTAFSKY